MRSITILNRPYAIDESNRKYKAPIGYFYLTQTCKYFVDGDRILWIWSPFKVDESFESPCLRYCLNYVMINDPKFKGMHPSKVLEAIGIYEPFKAKLYDGDMEWLKSCDYQVIEEF